MRAPILGLSLDRYGLVDGCFWALVMGSVLLHLCLQSTAGSRGLLGGPWRPEVAAVGPLVSVDEALELLLLFGDQLARVARRVDRPQTPVFGTRSAGWDAFVDGLSSSLLPMSFVALHCGVSSDRLRSWGAFMLHASFYTSLIGVWGLFRRQF